MFGAAPQRLSACLQFGSRVWQPLSTPSHVVCCLAVLHLVHDHLVRWLSLHELLLLVVVRRDHDRGLGHVFAEISTTILFPGRS